MILGTCAGLLVYRVFVGAPEREGFIVFENLESADLYERSIQIDKQVQFEIKARGGIDLESGTLAAYAWISDLENGQVVWVMEPGGNVETKRRYIAEAHDFVTLNPGLYTLYFTTYGSNSSSHQSEWGRGDRENGWQKYEEEWFLTASLVQGETTDLKLVRHDDQLVHPVFSRDEDMIWSTGPMGDDESSEVTIEVKSDIRVRLYGAGEIDREVRDFAYVDDLEANNRRWSLNLENSEYGGGASINRQFQTELLLKKGHYTVGYQTNDEHAYEDWEGNPPYFPSQWGVTVSVPSNKRHLVRLLTDDEEWNEPRAEQEFAGMAAVDGTAYQGISTSSSAIAELSGGEENFLLAFNQLGNGIDTSSVFVLEEKTQLHIISLGEITKSGERYDYGTIQEKNSGTIVWQLDLEHSVPAGGHDSNRMFNGMVVLEPGTYEVRFKTDETHAFGAFDTQPPTHPEAWGITIAYASEEP